MPAAFVVVAGLRDVGADVVVESAETDAIGGAVAVQVGQHRRQRMGAVEISAAVSADDLHARTVTEAQQMSQQEQRWLAAQCRSSIEDNRRFPGGHFQECDDGVDSA